MKRTFLFALAVAGVTASGAFAWLAGSPEGILPAADSTEPADATVSAVSFKTTKAGIPAKAEAETIYSLDLTTESDFKLCTVFNANGDKYTWEWNEYYGMPRCSSNGDSDDWLFLPGVELEGGKAYRMTIDIRNMSSNVAKKDRFNISAGLEPNVEAMTIEVLPPTVQEILQKEDNGAPCFNTHEGYIMPAVSGTYHVGIHMTTPEKDPDFAGWGMYIKNYRVYAGVQAAGPDNVTEAKAEGASNGDYTATVSFKAPTTDTAGDPLESIAWIDVIRDGQTVKSFDNPAPGESLSFVDNIGNCGDYTWKITPYNAQGEGKSVEVSAWVGTRIAKAPASATFTETSNPGEVTITWDAVTEDVDGNAIGEGKLSYRVYRVLDNGTGHLVADRLTATTCTVQAVDEGEQELVSYGVVAVTEAGESLPAQTTTEAIGTPYALPWSESFPDGHISSGIILGMRALEGNCMWSISTDKSFQNMHSADDDNGYLSFWSTGASDKARLYTGKFKMEGLKKPIVTFYLYKRTSGGADLSKIDVEVNDGNGWQTIQTVVAESYPLTGWNKVTVPLTDAFDGKTVQFGFTATKVNYTYQFIDAISIDSGLEYNLSVESLKIPAKVDRDETFTASVVYANGGLNEARGYKAQLLRDGEVVAEKECGALAPGDSKTTEFELTHDWTVAETAVYRARIDFASDEDQTDNASDDVAVKTYFGDYPTVGGMEGKLNADGAVISWSAPEIDSTVPALFTDDFESYPSFETLDLGQWRTYDLDKGKIGGLQHEDGTPINIPNATMNSQQSFWVMDASHPELSGMVQFTSGSGTKYLAQQYIVGGGKVDDWVVSPEVNAAGQTISFAARSFQSGDPETVEVLYSTTDRQPSAFTYLTTFENLPAQWARYEAELPEGARYFALRCVSVYKFMLFIDDISFIPAGQSNLKIEGYNIYRDGVKLNDAPVAGTSYADTDLPESPQTAVYAVQAVYNNGLSQLSDGFMLQTTGIEYTDVNAKEVKSVLLYDLTGVPVANPVKGSVYVQKTIYGDGSVKTERKLVR